MPRQQRQQPRVASEIALLLLLPVLSLLPSLLHVIVAARSRRRLGPAPPRHLPVPPKRRKRRRAVQGQHLEHPLRPQVAHRCAERREQRRAAAEALRRGHLAEGFDCAWEDDGARGTEALEHHSLFIG